MVRHETLPLAEAARMTHAAPETLLATQSVVKTYAFSFFGSGTKAPSSINCAIFTFVWSGMVGVCSIRAWLPFNTLIRSSRRLSCARACTPLPGASR